MNDLEEKGISPLLNKDEHKFHECYVHAVFILHIHENVNGA